MQRAAREREREFLGQVAPFSRLLLLERHAAFWHLALFCPIWLLWNESERALSRAPGKAEG